MDENIEAMMTTEKKVFTPQEYIDNAVDAANHGHYMKSVMLLSNGHKNYPQNTDFLAAYGQILEILLQSKSDIHYKAIRDYIDKKSEEVFFEFTSMGLS